MKILDISVSINDTTPLWPKVSGSRLDGSAHIQMDLHTGTHIDAPSHFISKGKSIDRLQLETFVGSVFVVHLPRIKKITAKDLEALKLPPRVTRLLFRTSNSLLWTKKTSHFKKEYVGLTADAAHWLVKHHIKLVGVDYLSVAKFDETILVHKILLAQNIALLEGINLTGVKQGIYQLMCLPINISDAEASPTRAILLKP